MPASVADPNFTAASPGRDIPDRSGSDRQIHRGDAGLAFERFSRPGQRAPERVADIMSANVECCTPDTELYYCARMMADRDVGAVPVVASTEEMRPVMGVITDRDIVVRVIAKRQDPGALRVRDAMTEGVITVRPDMSVRDCLRQMEQHQVRRIVVVDDEGRCCGIVAQADVARSLPQEESGEMLRDVSQPHERGGAGAYH